MIISDEEYLKFIENGQKHALEILRKYFKNDDGGGGRMSKFEIYLSKNDLEHIANGYDLKIEINDKRFLKADEIILKPALINDLMEPLLNYRYKLIDTKLQNIVDTFAGGAR